jgi:hypothetical protein
VIYHHRVLAYKKGISVSNLKFWVQWLSGFDYDGVRLTSLNSGHRWPIVHPSDECEWRAVVMLMPAGDKL